MSKEFLAEGQCLGDCGTFQGGVKGQYIARDLEDVKRYMKEVLIQDKAPHINWDILPYNDQQEAKEWCKLICHDTVNDWKKLHNV